MVIGVIGENCAGKSTLAEELKKVISAEVISGKDYLRMAKSESEAADLFRKKLANAVNGENIIYVISEKEQIDMLPRGAFRVLVTAGLDSIKERFKARMHGNLPQPVEQMLERKHGMFDSVDCDLKFDSDSGDLKEVCELIAKKIS